MNSLSWMVYLADVANALCGVAVLAMVLGAASSIVLAIRWKWHIDFHSDESAAASKKLFTGAFKVSAIVACVASFLVVFVPAKATIYAIAASEYGEDVLKTPEATKARAALNAWLDAQLVHAKPEK